MLVRQSSTRLIMCIAPPEMLNRGLPRYSPGPCAEDLAQRALLSRLYLFTAQPGVPVDIVFDGRLHCCAQVVRIHGIQLPTGLAIVLSKPLVACIRCLVASGKR